MATIKRKAKKEAPNAVINKTEAENSQLELFKVLATKKQLETREKELKARLATYMETALPTDDKGHRLFKVTDADGKNIYLQRQARKSIKLNQERAITFLKENDLAELVVPTYEIASEVTQDQLIEVLQKHAPEFLNAIEYVDEKQLETEVINEKITMEQLESLCDINITYAMTYIDEKKLEQQEEQ